MTAETYIINIPELNFMLDFTLFLMFSNFFVWDKVLKPIKRENRKAVIYLKVNDEGKFKKSQKTWETAWPELFEEG